MSKSLTVYEKKFPIKKLIAAILLLVIAAVVVFAVIYAVNKYEEEQYRETFGQSAIEVGGYTVTYDLYRYFYLNYRDEMKASFTDDDGNTDTSALDRAIREQIEEAVCGLYGSISLAGDYGLTLSDGDVKAAAIEYVDAVKAYYETEAAYEKELEANYMTDKVFELLMSVDCLEDKLFLALVSDGGEIEDNDERLMEKFLGDDFVRAKQVFIENDEGESIEENRALAERVLEEYRDGATFDSLIRHSEDFSMPPDGYYFTYLEMVEEFERAAFALRDGEVSDVVESEDGFHIIYRLPKDEKYLQDNFSDLKSQYQTSAFYKMIDERSAILRATETEFVRGLSYGEIY